MLYKALPIFKTTTLTKHRNFMYIVRYSSNNSGGSWWLSESDWKNLEKGGWTVEWTDNDFLGAKARDANKVFDNLDAAISDFESITGQDAGDPGCNCCGQPHQFSAEGLNGEKDSSYRCGGYQKDSGWSEW